MSLFKSFTFTLDYSFAAQCIQLETVTFYILSLHFHSFLFAGEGVFNFHEWAASVAYIHLFLSCFSCDVQCHYNGPWKG